MRVKVIEEKSIYKLENKVNDFIQRYKNDEIIDIKYRGSGNSPAYSSDYYSAMIIIK